MATFQEKTGADNPLNGITVGNASTPYLADLDNDGDLDAVVGTYVNGLQYLQNNNGIFTQQTGAANPFNGFRSLFNIDPALADIDQDGDLDVFVGDTNGTISYFQNNNGIFTQQTGATNPFNGFRTGQNARPSFGDLDGDGDLDAAIGSNSGKINYFQNNNGILTEQTGAANPLNIVNIGGGGLLSPALPILTRMGTWMLLLPIRVRSNTFKTTTEFSPGRSVPPTPSVP